MNLINAVSIKKTQGNTQLSQPPPLKDFKPIDSDKIAGECLQSYVDKRKNHPNYDTFWEKYLRREE